MMVIDGVLRCFSRDRSVIVGAVAVLVALLCLWTYTLFHASGASGAVDARVVAIGATVRCPVCLEPISVNDVENQEAIQMRQFIGDELKRGLTEDQVRQQLVLRYGVSILLAPPQSGFNLLIWVVPLGVMAFSATIVLRVIWRWSTTSKQTMPHPEPHVSLANSALSRFEVQLDQELAARQ